MLVFALFMATFALSSMWLYSPGPEKARKWLEKNGGKFAPLAYCQLCSGFWIGLTVHLIFAGPSPALAWALGYAGGSWLLGAIANSALWNKAYYELMYKKENGRKIKGQAE